MRNEKGDGIVNTKHAMNNGEITSPQPFMPHDFAVKLMRQEYEKRGLTLAICPKTGKYIGVIIP
ncbi:MAG: hypothetical protein WC455_25935 [Dehalococcoidia bacterium]